MGNQNVKTRFKRKQYLVQKRFQLKYIGLILVLTFLTAGLCSYVVYYTTMINLGEKLANVYPQGRLVSIVKMVNFRIMISIMLVTPLIVMIGVFLSHKIAGPVFRMEKFLKSMASGDLASRLTLRKGDELTGLADGINGVIDSFNASVRLQHTQMEKVLFELNTLKDLAGDAPQDRSKISHALDVLDADLRPVIAELDKFKL